MGFDFFTLSAIVVIASLALEFIHIRLLKVVHGLDLLFFAPWLFSVKFGFSSALYLAIALMIVHTVFNLHMAKFILLAIPALLVSIFFGTALGIDGFYTSLMVYMVICGFATVMFGGIGARFLIFIPVAILFNIGLFHLYQTLSL